VLDWPAKIAGGSGVGGTGGTAYDPFGNTTGQTGSTSTPLRYQGQYLSPETGLYYLCARHYDPATAQFTTRDPLNFAELASVSTGLEPALASDDEGASRVRPMSLAQLPRSGAREATAPSEPRTGALSYAAAVKTACALIGDATGPVRGPLLPLDDAATAELQHLLEDAGAALQTIHTSQPARSAPALGTKR
jgi:RHS repeat-associated protein